MKYIIEEKVVQTICGQPMPKKKLTLQQSGGYAIQVLRKQAGYKNGSDFARVISLSQSHLSRHESGVSPMTFDLIEICCKALEVNVLDYFGLVHLIYENSGK